MDLISVIVPVYRTEAYLDKCIASIVDQTYKNLEIILVDDGSPDRSGEICDAWAAKDSRIQVIHQSNAGGGAARNAALDAARGTLLAFVDSDDYIAPDMYEHLQTLIRQGADIAECAHVDVRDSEEEFADKSNAVRMYSAGEAMAKHIRDCIFRQLIWNKLYRREVIGEIRFPVGKRIDDEFFTYQVLGNAAILARSERICYAYRQQDNSIMHTLQTQMRLQAVDAKVKRHEYIRMRFPELTDLSLKNLWFTCIYQGQLSLRESDGETAKRVFTCLQDVLRKHPCKAEGCGTKEKLWLRAAAVSLPLTCRLRNRLKIGL